MDLKGITPRKQEKFCLKTQQIANRFQRYMLELSKSVSKNVKKPTKIQEFTQGEGKPQDNISGQLHILRVNVSAWLNSG